MSHFLIVVAPYYTHIVHRLLSGASDYLRENGHTFETIEVPGAFEIPAAIHFALHGEKHYSGFIALGCVIRGETTHYDYVCSECARGLQELAALHKAPIGFGVLTVENEQQALKRSEATERNKGREAAKACVQMAALKTFFMKDQ